MRQTELTVQTASVLRESVQMASVLMELVQRASVPCRLFFGSP